jgi:NhaA family Na+:H+ antiporter
VTTAHALALMIRRRRRSALRAFLRGEALGGLILMGAAALGLWAANSPLSQAYLAILHAQAGPLDVLHWINDGLMALFFLLVGLEIKREFVDGELSSWPRRLLPGVAAVGGMVAPALIYVAINWNSPATLRGWAAPAATDIAFTLGVLALLGRRAPVSLKIFVTTLAIIDDLGAVLIIAAFYTAHLSFPWLLAAALLFIGLLGLNRLRVMKLWPYLASGLLLWVCMLQSGLHATVAGVALALAIPLKPSPARPDDEHSPLHRLEHALNSWVAYAIVPLFGFANAGVPVIGIELSELLRPVTLGVAAGLVVGKPLGIFSFTWLAIRFRLADWPEHASVRQVFGVSMLCGIGFTMSLFIGLLAFPASPLLQDQVKLGVLIGSISSAFLGAAVLVIARRSASSRCTAGGRSVRGKAS